MKYLLGLDNGGTEIKAAIFDGQGRQIAACAKRVSLLTPYSGYTERDCEELWQANAAAIKEVLASSGIDPVSVAGVGISGHGKGLYLLDKQGKPYYNGIVSTDNRAEKIERRYYEDGTADKVGETNYQRVLACQPVCLLRWLKENRRDVYDKIGAVLSVKDYVRYRLTGEIFAERTDISGTNLLNLKTGEYDVELLKRFGIEEIFDALPPVKNSADVCGRVTAAAAAETGLAAGTILSGGLFDIDACAVGIGITDENDICMIAGTWSINEYISRAPVTDKSVAMNSYYCIPGYYLIEECSPTSAGNLDWVIGKFFGEELIAAGGRNAAFYEKLNAMVSSAPPSNVLFLPFLFASNEYPGLESAFVGLTAATTKGQIARAVYEGVVFSHKKHVDRLLASRNAPRAARLAGGAANSAVWSQMFADVLKLKIETVTGREHGCFGAAVTAGIASGVYKSYADAADSAVKPDKAYLPDEAAHLYYTQKYARYRKLIAALSAYVAE